MFPQRYFPPRYFPNRYFTHLGTNNDLILTIDGIDRTSLLVVDTFSYTDNVNGRRTASLRIRSIGPSANYFRPAVGQPIAVSIGGCFIFSGTIDRPDENEPVPDAVLFVDLECVDHNLIPDRRKVARIFEGQFAGDIIKDIVENELAGEGITTNGVETGLIIERAVFGYKTCTDVFNELSKLIGFHWFIDTDKDLKFFDRKTFVAPFKILPGNKKFLRGSMRVVGQREQYRNSETVRAGKDLTDPRTDTFQGDSKIKSFTLEFEVGAVPTVLLNGSPQTVGIRGIEEDKQFYWQKGEKQITQDKDDTALISSDTLSITYQGLFPIIVIVDDPVEQFNRAEIEGGTGIYEDVVDDRSIEKRAFAIQLGNGLLRRFGKIPVMPSWEFDVTCDELLKAGQVIDIDRPELNLVGDFLIDTIQFRDISGERIRATVSALSGEHLGSWFEFFRRLGEVGRDFSLNDEEVLLLIRQNLEAIEFSESFNTVDVLVDSSVDPFTCFVWGSATWGKSEWCKTKQP